MPRGARKQINYDEEIQRVEMQITKWKNTIAELEERRAQLLQAKKDQEVANLYEAVKASGKTIEQVISELSPESDQPPKQEEIA